MNELKKKILLVEDDMFIRDIYNTKFTQEGFDVQLAENGIKALEKLKMNIPDLVLLDIVMPYMDGLGVLKEMKASEIWKNIPVIMLTNISEKDKMSEGMQQGVEGYLIKSHFTPSEVVEKVRAFFENGK